MLVAAHQPLFLPWMGYFNKINMADVFVFSNNIQFTPSGWIARNSIKTDKGSEYLSVPVKGKKNSIQLIKQVQIVEDNGKWKNKHLRTIEWNYRKTPFFK